MRCLRHTPRRAQTGIAALIIVAVLVVALPGAATSVVPTSPCELIFARGSIEAIRAATPAELPALRAQAEAAGAGDDDRGRACAAAIVAEAAVAAGDLAAALAALDVMVAGLPQFSADVLPHRVLLLAELGRTDDARAAFAGVPRQSAWSDRLLAVLGISDERAAALRRRASRDPRALATLCHGYDDVDPSGTTKRVAGDRSACAKLLLQHPGHDGARALEDDSTNQLVLPFRGAALARRLRGLLEAARPGRVVVEGLAAARDGAPFGLDDEAHADVVEVVASALWRLDRTAEALPLSARGTVTTDGVIRLKSAALAKVTAKTLSRLDRSRDAAAVWALIRDDANTDVRDDVRAEAAFFAGFSFVEANAADDALAAFATGAPLMRGTPWQEQGEWYVALVELTDKQRPAAAIPTLRALAKQGAESRKYQYFLAKALSLDPAGKNEAGRIFKALRRGDPTDWYGLLSARAMGETDSVPAARGALEAQAPKDAFDAQLLYALGFDDEAKARCRQKAGTGRVPPMSQIALCFQIDDANFGWKHNGLLGRLRDEGSSPLRLSAWDATYPWPYRHTPWEAAKRSAVPVTFILAIMRTESGFDAEAASRAGAKGLMQLLPSSARATAKAANLDMALTARLLDPDANITLGSALLGLLLREHGSMLQAAAAYNGGPENAARWATRFGHLPVDVFVERITFKETRNYVKRALATEATYRAMMGKPLTLELPQQVEAPARWTPLPYDE